ncbi:phosphoenolpyruvate-protein phosphotransferase [Actinotalea ferrariae CF5-4]|uniref:Phosphoenolpyruvate-protein phosphotransferase n=1 Tax=Actinotalea ferrariae CF5-4 TaxID=948458 RepID=A0A021VXE0_9CELL|nr:phosphoenolpyruvate--protein phosphotransferase [Actinotalea ferrariae]EYR64695.1 phosphoenolpyruvate-protein phosphotransferase [Actinotalea ferrariae CF5-4]
MTGRVLHGTGVGRGAVIGPVVRVHSAPAVDPATRVGTDAADAHRLLDAAFTTVAQRLQQQADGASGTLREVLAATAQMAADPALRSQSLQRVDAGEPVVAAVDGVVDTFATMFEQAGGYLAERVTDLRSVRDRVVAEVLGVPAPGVPVLDRPSVVVAVDLAPADTATLDLERTLALVTSEGGPTGHTAIIAGQLGIPCLVQVTGATDLPEGTEIAVDAATGTVTVDPDDDVRAAVAERRAVLATLAEDTSAGATADGHQVALLANIGTAEDAERLTDAAVEGVGLFRTEVLFLGRDEAPSEEEQAATYTRALRALGDRKLVLRTLDAGADKPLPFVTQPGEENPALGVRGYRLVRRSRELLETQLRAAASAAREAGGELWVMAPMIATVDEAADFAALARAAGVTQVGVMVEVPSAALRARDVLHEVDFVSLGTNDLAQYAMATDRLRGELSDLLDPWQPAVLDLVAHTAEAGTDLGKPVGVCGESASDPLMALVLVGLGVSSLSMAPSAVPGVRMSLARHTLEQCRQIAGAARAARSAADARAACLALVDPEVRRVLALG